MKVIAAILLGGASYWFTLNVLGWQGTAPFIAMLVGALVGGVVVKG